MPEIVALAPCSSSCFLFRAADGASDWFSEACDGSCMARIFENIAACGWRRSEESVPETFAEARNQNGAPDAAPLAKTARPDPKGFLAGEDSFQFLARSPTGPAVADPAEQAFGTMNRDASPGCGNVWDSFAGQAAPPGSIAFDPAPIDAPIPQAASLQPFDVPGMAPEPLDLWIF